MDNLPETNNVSPAASEIRLITSAKGGVGKSTVCANLGAALAENGKRVLLIDCDIANRCLDLMLGLENEAIFGIRDVSRGEVSLSDAIYPAPTLPGLHLLAGSRLSDDDIETVTGALPQITAEAQGFGYDHILIDTPGGLHEILFAAAALVHEAIIVSSAQATAIRSAEQTAQLLEEVGVPAMRLIVNQFMAAEAMLPARRSPLSRRKRTRNMQNAALTLIDTVDSVSLPLLGVIPFDASLWDAQNRGCLIDDPSLSSSLFAAAHRNIAKRLLGRSIPLFTSDKI